MRVFFSLHTLSITQEHFSDGGWVELGLDLPADDNDDDEKEDDDDGGADQAAGWPADSDDGSDHDNGGGGRAGGGGGGGARGKLREGVPRSPGQLHELEVVHAVVDTYLWLVRKSLCVERKSLCVEFIENPKIVLLRQAQDNYRKLKKGTVLMRGKASFFSQAGRFPHEFGDVQEANEQVRKRVSLFAMPFEI